jgi:N4-gp56 family major capsid protein
MATLDTTTSNFSSTVVALVARRIEEALRADYVHITPGNFTRGEAKIADGFNSLTYVAYADLAATTTALTQGTAPTDQALVISVDQATATQIGNTVAISDLADLQSPHRLIAVAADKVADQAVKSFDVLVREILNAGSSVQYVTATSRATIATSNVLTGAQVKKMFTILKRNNVPTFGDGFYRAIVHPDSLYDLQTDTANGGWMDANKYTNARPLLTNEVGMYGGVRFQISSQAKVFATAGASSANVYSTIFLGPEAYVVGDMQSIRTYFVPPGGDHSDPIAQKALVGWKTAFGCMLLDANGARYVRLEHGTTLDLG